LVPSGDPDGAVRASDAERERVVDLLRGASAEGRLTIEELETRTAQALAARTRAELEPLTADLPRSTAHAEGIASTRGRRHGPSRDHLAAYVAVNLLLIVIWAATGAGYFWPIWPLLGWGIGVFSHSAPFCGAARRRHGSRSHRTPSPT